VNAKQISDARKKKRQEKALTLWPKKIKRARAISLSKLRKQVWAALSAWVRYRDNAIYGHCVICRSRPIECAYHLIPSNQGAATRWDPDNIKGACSTCNFNENHNRAKYAFIHIRLFGIEEMTRLDALSRETRQYKRSDFEAMLHRFQALQKEKTPGN
jgi:5-methylcytosine-specific restriction endonuclease McrA